MVYQVEASHLVLNDVLRSGENNVLGNIYKKKTLGIPPFEELG
jgi:hypothetical protein